MRVIHVERELRVSASVGFSCFSSVRKLRKWYDRESRMTAFQVGGRLEGGYFPSYQIVALVRNQLIVQRFQSVIDGIGIWSFVARGKRSRLILDHVAEGNQGEEFFARYFHWQGLMENVAALCEQRSLPFKEGQYEAGLLPPGIKFTYCPEYVTAMIRRISDRGPISGNS